MKESFCVAPVTGTVIPIEKVPDPVFSGKTLGDGIAVIPRANYVCAPVDGILKLMFHTGHAFVIEGNQGEEVMVHIGIDTVAFRGEGFHKMVRQGSKVRCGDKIVSFDEDYLKFADMTTMVILMNGKEGIKIQKNYLEKCRAGFDVVMKW